MSQDKNSSELESNILFEGVKPEILQSFANPKNTIGKREGAVIFQKGDLTEYLYLLIEGTVKLKITEPDGTNIYINKSENSFFGELELLGKTQRKSSAVADTDCRLYTLNLSELKILAKKDNMILKNLYSHKTFDIKKDNFKEMTKEFLDPDTDFSQFTKSKEINPITKDNSSTSEETPQTLKEIKEEEIHGAFDKIITNDDSVEGITEQFSESERDTEAEIAKDESEELPATEIIKEEISGAININEDGQDRLDLYESEGFVINKIDDQEHVEETLNESSRAMEEPVAEPIGQMKEEKELSPKIEEEKQETDFSDYYENLLKATQNIFSQINIDETAEVISVSAAKLVNAEGGVLYIVDKENEELKAKVLSDSSIKNIIIKFSDGLQGTAIVEKRSIISVDSKKEKNFNPVIEDLTGIKIKNVIYYPVMTRNDDPVALLELYNSERDKFDSREIELLNAISPSILKALNNARYVDILVQQKKILSISEITSFINEDIKNPLHKVKQYSSLLKKKNLSPEVEKLIDIQIGQINTIEDFLKFIDAYAKGKNILEKSIIKVSEAVPRILNFLAEYVESRNTVLYKKIEDDALVNIDLPAMYVVCYQIAKNACDAMNDEGKIFVTTEKDGDYIKIKFKDTGTGISETIKGKLFKPFVTYGKKQKPGLGLAIAEKLITDQGGFLLAESVLGEGATFTIALPIVF
jgi:signal transduction histidine kinase